MKTAQRTKGDGSLYQRANGTWVGSIEAGWDEQGKRRRKWITGKTQADALKKLREARRQIQDHGVAQSASTTLEKWLDVWVEDVAKVRPTTRVMYRRAARLYLVPKLGKVRLDKLTPAHVRELHKWMAEKGLSTSTVQGAHRVLQACLSDAVDDGILMGNVAQRAKPPRIVADEVTVLTAEQARRVIVETKDDWYGPRWATSLLIGARQGEVLGMEWSRVDFNARTLDLSWQLQRIPYRHGCKVPCGKRPASCPRKVLDVKPGDEYRQIGGGLCLTRPKTAGSVRLVPMTELHAAILLRQWEQQDRNPHGLVFTRPDGKPIDYARDSEAWHAMLDRLGLPSVKLHAARHTTATLLKADQRTREAIMGHSSAAMALHYQHVDLTMQRVALEALSGAIDS